ncbi:GerAB/ArcD/ProY family transporter [Cohnella sp. GCM10027633]|uniref:GerAB/ArcD/ProY family transporter n=1 Tax=unclassified Cohnella TaxID=2636738 RepID=UPI00363A13ED
MNEKNSITNIQIGSLAFTFVFSTSIAFLLSPLAGEASTDGIWCLIAGGVLGTAFSVLAMRYAIKKPGAYLGVQGKAIVGRAAHTAILLLVAFFLLHLAAFILREFTDFFVLTYLRETPPIAVSALVMLAAWALTQAGVSAVFRFAQGTFLFIGLFFLVKPLFFVADMNMPIWHEFIRFHDWRTIGTQTYSILPWFGELILLAFIVPQFASPRRASRAIWIGSLAGIYILIAEYVLVMMFFGPKLTATLIYPALELAGFVHLGDFIHNMDAVIVSIWITAFFIKLSILFAAGTFVTSQALALKDYKPIAAPLGALVVLVSIHQAKNPSDMSDFFASCWSTYALAFELLPFVYPLVAWARRRFV